MTQTINKWEGTGSELAFQFSLDNYNPEFNELEGFVKDADGNIDASYTWEIDTIVSTQVNLLDATTLAPKALAAGYSFTLQIKIESELPVWYDANSIDINDNTLNAVTIDLINRIQAVKDHRTNARIEPEDMNNQRIVNVAAGVDMNDAVNVQQLSDGIGNIDTLVQRAETAADESEAARDESLGYAQDAEDSADAALISETNAAASEAAVLLQFKGEWLNDYPSGTGTGYDTADVTLHDNNLWYSKIDNNTDIPEVGSQLPIPTWTLYLPGSADSAELVAKIYRATFNGDGVTTEFDLTANNALFRPTSENQLFYVSVDQSEVIDFDLNTRISDGHSIITFTTPPPTNTDPNGAFNIIVIGATPKLISLEGLPENPVDGHYLKYNDVAGKYEDVSKEDVAADLGTNINLPINDTILYNNDTLANTVTWQGTARSDDNTTNIIANDYIHSPELHIDITPTMTSNSTPAGNLVSTSSDQVGFEGYKIFDGIKDASNVWLSSTLPASVDLSMESSVYTDGYRLYNKLDDFSSTPNTWTVEGSNDGVSWNVLDSRSGYTDWDTGSSGVGYKDFTFNTSTGDYSYYRLSVTAVNGSSITLIVELELYHKAYISLYLFVGKDISSNTVLEWDTDIDGANLTNITGVKRRIGDDKDIVFPTDGNGDLAYFERNFGTWEFELWSGSATSGTLTLNNNIDDYSMFEFIGVVSGSEVYTTIATKNTLNNTALSYALFINGNNPDTYRQLAFHKGSSNSISISGSSNMAIVSIKGVK